MATRHLKTRPQWEQAIRDGTKTIDARPVADDIAELCVGDLIRYPGASARVRRVRYYAGFGDLLAHEDLHKIDPAVADRQQLHKLLENGHAQTVRRNGVVAIELEPAG